MRIMFDRKTGVINGVIAERVTSHIPKSNTPGGASIDIDYDHTVVDTDPLAKMLENEGSNLIGKKIVIGPKNISFEEAKRVKKPNTVMVNLEKPKLDNDVAIYSAKAEKLGVTVDIEDIDSVIVAKMYKDDKEVGQIRLVKITPCGYLYESGSVVDRSCYPHYIGFSKLIKHLQKKQFRWLDMGGLTKHEEGINRFKKKWGELAETIVPMN